MAIRNLLHLNKLDDFREWMEYQGWEAVPTKGEFEILRLIKLNEKPIILYQRFDCDHAVVQDKDYKLVKRFVFGKEHKSKTAIDLIAKERQRQVNEEGWTPEHDDQHAKGELARAAACYAVPDNYRVRVHYLSELWPWELKWWKPAPDNRKRELIKAAALIVAEIERIDRLQESEG